MSTAARLLRPDLKGFAAYESAKPQRGVVRLHANESSWRADWDETDDGLNRYPEPRPPRASSRVYGMSLKSGRRL